MGSSLALFGLGAASSLIQLRRAARESSLGRAKAGVIAMIGEPLLRRSGLRTLAVSFALYYALLAWATGSLVVRPGQDFTAAYGVAVPSVQVFPCCGPPGSIPQYNVYLAQGLGLLILPTNLLLALSVSLLASLSVAVALATLSQRRLAAEGLGGAGLAGGVGILASCTTCAAQAILALFLGPGAIGLAVTLAPWQLYFVFASVGILLATLWAQGRWIARARNVCRPNLAASVVSRGS